MANDPTTPVTDTSQNDPGSTQETQTSSEPTQPLKTAPEGISDPITPTPDTAKKEPSGSRSLRLAMKEKAEAKKTRDEAEALKKSLTERESRITPLEQAIKAGDLNTMLSLSGMDMEKFYDQLTTLNQKNEEKDSPDKHLTQQIETLQEEIVTLKEKELQREYQQLRTKNETDMASWEGRVSSFLEGNKDKYRYIIHLNGPDMKSFLSADGTTELTAQQKIQEQILQHWEQTGEELKQEEVADHIESQLRERHAKIKQELSELDKLLIPPEEKSEASTQVQPSKEKGVTKPLESSLSNNLSSSSPGMSNRPLTRDEALERMRKYLEENPIGSTSYSNG